VSAQEIVMKKILSVSIVIFALLILVSIILTRSGFVPVNADAVPSSLEKRLFPMVVHASVARGAKQQPSGESSTAEDLLAGAEIYKGLCAQCHGKLNGRPSVFGASFYPPAPQLPGQSTSYSEAEIFWIVKHGIRNTSMPAWRNLLSDEDIWHVTAFVKRLDSLPPDVETAASTPESKTKQE
jgi:mono/diheme cytochrome c family protein